MKNLFLLISLVLFVLQTQAQGKVTPLVLGEKITLTSTVLQEERTLNVYLPHHYDSTKNYPVMYVLDGSWNEDFIHICGVVQFFNLQFQMPEFIVVGIANVDRKRDFTFHTDLKDLQDQFPTSGHSNKFIDFLSKELKPFINQQYPTNDTSFIIGQSLGGLLATEVLIKNPSLFSHYLIVSPSLWWDNESLLNQADSLFNSQNFTNLNVYVSVGKDEHRIMKKEAKKINSILRKSNKSNLTIFFNPMKNENHATILHHSIYDGLHYLFSETKH